ncbi:MAG: hypothetical protein QNJ55_01670 [Xenococcus sp. MO_188.B8]|nr:hypothetical protein [Xenococcus sp. MO_188.B8]
MIRWFFEKLRNLFSTEVPAALAACEFDCREVECLTKEFLTCPRRLQKAEALKRLSEAEPTNNFKSQSSTLG